jgi:hypothetical protein
MRASKLSKVLAIPTPSSGSQYPFVQFRHSEFVDDEALEVAREDREECDRNEPMRCSFEHSKMVFNRR